MLNASALCATLTLAAAALLGPGATTASALDERTPSCTGAVQVTDLAGGAHGYASYDADGGFLEVSTDLAAAVQVDAPSGAQQSLSYLGAPATRPDLGAIVGFHSSATLAAGSGAFMFLGQTAGTSAGSAPASGENSYSLATGNAELIESPVWTRSASTADNPTGTALTPQWVNPDASTPATHVVLAQGTLFLTGDVAAFASANATSAVEVMLTVSPAAGATCTGGTGGTGGTGSLTAQRITYTSTPPSPGLVGATYAVSATGGGSDQPVTFTTTTSPVCTVSGAQVSLVAAGTCTIAADQAGDATHSAAPTATQDLTVARGSTGVSIDLDHPTAVFGQPVVPTVTVTGGAPGTVQLSLGGAAVGDPVRVGTDGTASGAALRPAVGSTTVGAVFTPSDQTSYDAATATGRGLKVTKAPTAAQVSATGSQVRATVTAVAPGAGVPTGTVSFSLDGTSLGTAALQGGTAVMDAPVSAERQEDVAVAYSGDDGFAPSSRTPVQGPPTITVSFASKVPKSAHGFYSGPVLVSFVCRTHGAPLTAPCPSPVIFRTEGAGQTVTVTVSDTANRSTTRTINGVNIDLTPPTVTVGGIAPDELAFVSAPSGSCRSTDALAGVASCTLSRVAHATSVAYTATATDLAGNTSTRTLTVHVASLVVAGATYSDGVFTLHRGHTYTLRSASTPRPAYLGIAVGARRPTGPGKVFKAAGTHRWSYAIAISKVKGPQMRTLGVRIGTTVHYLTLEVLP